MLFYLKNILQMMPPFGRFGMMFAERERERERELILSFRDFLSQPVYICRSAFCRVGVIVLFLIAKYLIPLMI